MHPMPTREQIAQFIASMPARYARDFDHPVISQHAAAWFARGDRIASVSRFLSRESHGDALCLIADDRPGLLSLFAAAFVATGLDVVSAKAYTRRQRGRPSEAVALFWVQHSRPDRQWDRVSAEDIGAVLVRLTEILENPASIANLHRRPERPSQPSAGPTVVRFIEGPARTLSNLEVEAEDRFGLLLALSRALHEQRAVIESCEVHTKNDRVSDSFSIAESDGSPISPTRRLEIQVAILSAIEAG